MEDREIGGLIKRISIQLRILADIDMKEFDLTWSQVHVLHHLGKHGGSMTQKELEKELGIAHPTMVGLVKRLESKGFVTTRTSETDHRMKIVTATDRAMNHKQFMHDRMKEKEQIMTQGMTADDIERLQKYLQQVHQNLANHKEGILPGNRGNIPNICTENSEGCAPCCEEDSVSGTPHCESDGISDRSSGQPSNEDNSKEV